MAAPQPENKLPRTYQILELRDVGLIDDTQLAAMLSYIDGELTTAGRIYPCPKCGTAGYYPNIVDDPGAPDEYPVQCTAVDQADPTSACLGWGFTPTDMHILTVPNVYTSA